MVSPIIKDPIPRKGGRDDIVRPQTPEQTEIIRMKALCRARLDRLNRR
jgi:hypothetical protein